MLRLGKSARALVLAVAVCAATAATGASAAASTPAAPQSAASLPTATQVERATRTFLRSAPESGGGISPPGKTGSLFPEHRMVALYGSPAMPSTILGRLNPPLAKRRLKRQAKAYKGHGRPVIRAFDLVAVLATQCSGPRDKCNKQTPDSVIRRYLALARSLNGRLVLDIQPGRSTFLHEIRALHRWVVKPDVDIALDPEWNLGPHGTPGKTRGSVSARYLNRVSHYLEGVVKANHLPPKALVVHQFRSSSIQHRNAIKERPDVAVTLDFDGIGSPKAKKAGYERYSRSKLFDGIMLFYRLDKRLMSPRQVLSLRPEPDFVGYQ